MSETANKTLLAIIELGGYPDFSPLYRDLGFEVVIEGSMRRALGYLKRHAPAVVVAELRRLAEKNIPDCAGFWFVFKA
jgi:hypothetical protein